MLKGRQPLLFLESQVETLHTLIRAFLPFVELLSCLLVQSLWNRRTTRPYTTTITTIAGVTSGLSDPSLTQNPPS
jgi:hypothetical protein